MSAFMFCSWPFTCDGICEVLVAGLAQQSHKRGDAVAVLDGDLVVGVSAVGDVLERSASRVVHLLLWVVQHGHQGGDALQATYLRLYLRDARETEKKE